MHIAAWQRIGDEIDAAMIFARSDFVTVSKIRQWHRRYSDSSGDQKAIPERSCEAGNGQRFAAAIG